MSEVAATAEPAAPLAGGPSAPPPRGPVGDDPDPTTPFDRPPGPTRRSLFGFFRRSRAGSVGLRRRILLIFTLGSMTLSAFLAVTTYGLVRSNLIEQRYSTSRLNARQLITQLSIVSTSDSTRPSRTAILPRGPNLSV